MGANWLGASQIKYLAFLVTVTTRAAKLLDLTYVGAQRLIWLARVEPSGATARSESPTNIAAGLDNDVKAYALARG